MLDQEIREYTDQIWRQALRLEVTPVASDAVDPGASGPKESVTAFIHFTGEEWSGACLLQVAQATALKLACALLEFEEEDVDLETRDDAMGELANMLGGNLKPFLPGPPTLSLPSVSVGEDVSVTIPKTELLCECWFECEGESFCIRLVEKAP